MKRYIELEHTADIKYQIYGKDISGVFSNSVYAFSNYISQGKKIKNKIIKEISLSAGNIETLLYKFIDELIYLLDAEGFAVESAKINVDESNFSIKGKLIGDKTSNYKLKHVKAATYSEMFIRKDKNGFVAQIVLDV